MKKRITFFQVMIIIVAIGAVGSQLTINSYYELNAPIAGRVKLVENKIAEFYQSPEYLRRGASDDSRKEIIRNDAAIRNERNKRSVDDGGKLVTTLKAQTDSIGVIDHAYQVWLDNKLNEIKTTYGQSNETASWGGVGLIFVFEFLAIILGFMAARVWYNEHIQSKRVKGGLTIATALASLISQGISCQITYRGLYLLLNDSTMSEIYASGFVGIVPFFFWLGSLDFETKMVTVSNGIENPVPSVLKSTELQTIGEPKAQVETHTAEETYSHIRKLTKMKAEVPMSQILKSENNSKPDSWELACVLIRQGKLNWSERDVVRNFPDVSRYRVREKLKILSPPSQE